MKTHLAAIIMLVVFAGLYASTLDSHGMLIWDEAEYATLARDLSRGDPYSSSFRLPLVPLASATAMKISGSHQDVMLKTPIALFGIVALGLVYGVMMHQHGQAAALAAAGFLGLSPTFWQHTSYLLSEIPFLTFFAAASFFFVFGLYHDPRWFWACWFSTGLAFLTRYTCVLLGPTFLFYLILGWHLGGPTARSRLRSAHFWVSPLLGLLVLSPWLVRQYLAYQNPLIGFQYASGQLQSYLPELTFPALYYLAKLPSMVTWPVLMLAIAGFVWGWRKRDPLLCHSLLSVVFLLIWFSCYRYKEVRLVTSILPFLAIGAGAGLTKLLGELWKPLAGKDAVLLVVGGLTVVSWQSSTQFFTHGVALGFPSLKMAVDRLKPLLGPDDVVMGASQPQLAWYLDRQVVGFPSQEKLPEQLQNVAWVVIVNYEKGQPGYVAEVINQCLSNKDTVEGKAHVLKDPAGHLTALVPADLLQQRLAARPK